MLKIPEQVVLVGIPGSGKSTIGPLLARRLSWGFVDFDAEIESATGLTVAQIFRERGEPEFRRLESELTARVASERDIVIAPGAGWILWNHLPDALIAWLQTTAEEAIHRMGEQANNRPLLQPNPIEKMRKLLAERRRYYEPAHIKVETDGMTADAVAAAVASAVENYGNQEN